MTQPGEREKLVATLRDLAKFQEKADETLITAAEDTYAWKAAAILEADGVELARMQAKCDSQAAELKHQDAELAALRKDAERYRWLRKNNLITSWEPWVDHNIESEAIATPTLADEKGGG